MPIKINYFFSLTIIFLSLLAAEENKAVVPQHHITIYNDSGVVTKTIDIKAKESTFSVPNTIDQNSLIFDDPKLCIRFFYLTEEKSKYYLYIYSDLALKTPISYNFSGISWGLNYVLTLSAEMDHVENINAQIELDNQSTQNFEQSKLSFISANNSEDSENFESSQVYRLAYDRLVDVPCQKIIKLPWFSYSKLEITKDYRIDVGQDLLKDLHGETRSLSLDTWIHVDPNQIKKKLVPGLLTLYVKTKKENLLRLGTIEVSDIDIKDRLSIKIPRRLFQQMHGQKNIPIDQIHSEMEQIEYKDLTDKIAEASYRVIIRNTSNQTAKLKVDLSFKKEHGKIVRSNIDYVKENPREIYWPINIAPKTEMVLRYRVQLTREY